MNILIRKEQERGKTMEVKEEMTYLTIRNQKKEVRVRKITILKAPDSMLIIFVVGKDVSKERPDKKQKGKGKNNKDGNGKSKGDGNNAECFDKDFERNIKYFLIGEDSSQERSDVKQRGKRKTKEDGNGKSKEDGNNTEKFDKAVSLHKDNTHIFL